MQTTSRGFKIDYTVDGDGPPLVLLAATLSSAAHWRQCGYIDALAPHWRVVAIDPLGHGRSDTPHDPDAYRIEGVVEDVVAVLDAENIDRTVVWGYSRGGWLGCGLAAAHPQRVQRLVVGGYAMHAHEQEAGLFLGPLASFLRRGDWTGLTAAPGAADSAILAALEQSNDALAVAAAIDGSLAPTRYIDPATIHCPTIHYVGADDWIVDHVRADAAALDATVDLIPGQGHLGAFFSATEPVLAKIGPRLAAPFGRAPTNDTYPPPSSA